MTSKRFKLATGIKISDTSGINEGYDETKVNDRYSCLRVNVSAEHIAKYFLKLLEDMEEPGFFVVELPVSKQEEANLRKKDSDPCHKRVFYLDGISRRRAIDIFRQYEPLFTKDGMVNFGFGSITHEEVYVGAYKIFEIFTPEPEKFRSALESLGIKHAECLTTVKDKIGPEMPGERCTVNCEPSLGEMLSEVMKMGFYLADTRED